MSNELNFKTIGGFSEDAQFKLFQYLDNELGAVALHTNLMEIFSICSAETAAELARVKAINEELLAALKEVANWNLPPSGKTWEDGSPMSYGAAWGSNGERDYIRRIAQDAIVKVDPDF